MSGRPTQAQVPSWAAEVAAVGERIGKHCRRSGPRRRAARSVRGLLGDARRKDGRPLAEHPGEATPGGVRHLPARAGRDADAVRDDLRRDAVEHLGHPGGVPVVGETGFVKRGTKSVGGARQYGGAAGRIEDCRAGASSG